MLLHEYPDVLSNELSPEPMKTDTPMHIHIKEGASPKKVTTARQVPLRYESKAEKTVQELIQRGVIVPANKTTDWCSPAFFVPKGDKIRVRLVTNYTEVTRIEPKEILLEEYPDALSDELSPEPMKTDAPMHIHIKEGTTPRKVTTARRDPLRYECKAEKTVQEPVSYTHLTLPTIYSV